MSTVRVSVVEPSYPSAVQPSQSIAAIRPVLHRPPALCSPQGAVSGDPHALHYHQVGTHTHTHTGANFHLRQILEMFQRVDLQIVCNSLCCPVVRSFQGLNVTYFDFFCPTSCHPRLIKLAQCVLPVCYVGLAAVWKMISLTNKVINGNIQQPSQGEAVLVDRKERGQRVD